MGKYRKKPVVIEATLWDGTRETLDHLLAMGMVTSLYSSVSGKIQELRIKTLEGSIEATEGDWIIRGVQGEFYPYKPDIFEQTYEAVDDAE